jgi:hypothetical protein
MKIVILAYAFIILIFVAILSLLSYGYDSGYVYIYWRNLQVQTNIWVILFFTILTSFIIQILWMLCKKYFSREQRKVETVFNFKNLHPYEQLAVISLLDAEIDQKDFIHNVFANSGLLNAVIDAQIEFIQGNFDEALKVLESSNAMAFELTEIQRIRIYLAQLDSEKALTHLEFLNQHELSPWLVDVKNSYDQTLQELWGSFAVLFPWDYLRSTKYGHLDEDKKVSWLKQLLKQFDKASSDNLQDLQNRYLALSDNIESKSFEVNVLWLKLLSRLPEMSAQHEELAEYLLGTQFDQEVFYMWFQQQVLKQNPNYSEIENKINYWEQKYPALPIFSFAKWHVYQEQGRLEEADQLLDLYPDHVLMNYLRIKSTLKDQDHLIQQLNLIFENNANHVVIKI